MLNHICDFVYLDDGKAQSDQHGVSQHTLQKAFQHGLTTLNYKQTSIVKTQTVHRHWKCLLAFHRLNFEY